MEKSKNKKGSKLIWIILAGLLVVIIIIGIYFVSKTFCCGVKPGELTDAQLKTEIGKLFSDESKLAIYPTTRLIEITKGDKDLVALGIKNILVGNTANKAFSYVVTLSGLSGCSAGIPKATAESWITTGRTKGEIPIPPGDFSVQKIVLTIPDDAPTCIVKYGISVMADETLYSNSFFEVKIS